MEENKYKIFYIEDNAKNSSIIKELESKNIKSEAIHNIKISYDLLNNIVLSCLINNKQISGIQLQEHYNPDYNSIEVIFLDNYYNKIDIYECLSQDLQDTIDDYLFISRDFVKIANWNEMLDILFTKDAQEYIKERNLKILYGGDDCELYKDY